MLRFVSQFLQTGDVMRRRRVPRSSTIVVGCLIFGVVSIAQIRAGNGPSRLQSADALSIQQAPEIFANNPQIAGSLDAQQPDQPPIVTSPLYDAWVYPDAPGAMQTLRSAGNINAIKAEFLHVNDDGSLEQITKSESAPNGYSPDNVAFMKRYSREQYVTVSGTVQGTEQAMRDRKTITGMADMANKTGFGIELDWEEYGQWTPEYYRSYKTFVTRLATELHADGHRLIIDGPPIYDQSSQAWYQWKYEELAPLVDSIVMMIYDNQYDMGVGTSIAPKNWSLDCMQWLKRTAGDKGTAGIAAYGYSGNKDTGRIAVNSSTHIRRQIGSLNIDRNSDGELVATSGQNFYAYADQQTLQTRLGQVKQSDIGRLSVWSLGDNPWFKR